MSKYKHIANSAELAKKLKTIAKQTHDREDPFVITEYKKLFTRTVGLFARGNVTAYLIKHYLDNQRPHSNQRSQGDQRSQNTQRSSQRPKPARDGEKSPRPEREQERYAKYLLPITQDETTREELQAFLESLKGIQKEAILYIRPSHKNTLVHVKKSEMETFVEAVNQATFKTIKLKATPLVYNRNRRRR